MAGLPCPSPILKFPIPCSPLALAQPRPHRIPPASFFASPTGPWPTTCRPSPASRPQRIGGWENPGRVHQYAWVGQTGNRLRPKMLSAWDSPRALWAGLEEKKDAVAPPTHCRLVQSPPAPRLCSGPGETGAGLAPRSVGAQDLREPWRTDPSPCKASHKTLRSRPHSLRSCCPPVPRGAGPQAAR